MFRKYYDRIVVDVANYFARQVVDQQLDLARQFRIQVIMNGTHLVLDLTLANLIHLIPVSGSDHWDLPLDCQWLELKITRA